VRIFEEEKKKKGKKVVHSQPAVFLKGEGNAASSVSLESACSLIFTSGTVS